MIEFVARRLLRWECSLREIELDRFPKNPETIGVVSMTIKARCSQGHAIRVKDEHAGKTVRCPQCGEAVPIPDAYPDIEREQADRAMPIKSKARSGPSTRRTGKTNRSVAVWKRPIVFAGGGLALVVAVGLFWWFNKPGVETLPAAGTNGPTGGDARRVPVAASEPAADQPAAESADAAPLAGSQMPQTADTIGDSRVSRTSRPTVRPSVLSADETQAIMKQTEAAVRQKLETIYAEQYVPGEITPDTELDLEDGRQLTGKLLFFPPYRVVITKEGQRHILDYRTPEGKVKSSRRISDRPETRPDLPDLDVTYIERTPRTRSNHGNVDYPGGLPKLKRPNEDRLFPLPGTKVTFTAHVVNRGARDTQEATYRWLLDGRPIGDGKLAGLAPKAEATALVQWDWQDGPHEITFAVDPDQGTREISRLNNQLTDRTDARGFLIHVTKDALEEYNSAANLVESFSFEDWVQHHFLIWNLIFQSGIFPESPEGCLVRCRVDKILYVNAASARQEVEQAQQDGHEWGNYFQGTWHFEKHADFRRRMQSREIEFLHEMGHQLGLIDEYRQDINAGEVQLPAGGPFAFVHHFHSNTPSLMGNNSSPLFSDQAVVALNVQQNRPGGYFGDYQFVMPSSCRARVLDRSGRPLASATVNFYRRVNGKFTADGFLAGGATDDRGEFPLPNQPTPEYVTDDGLFRLRPNFLGKMDTVGSQGSVLVCITHHERSEWHVLEASKANVAAMAGHDEYVFEFPTQFAESAAPPGPKNLKAAFRNHNTVDIRFDPVPGAREYRLYGKKDGEVPTVSPYTLLRTHNAAELQFRETGVFPVNSDQPLTLVVKERENLYLAVTAVDEQGRESDWSNVANVHPLQAVNRIAVAADGKRYISDVHGGRIFRQNPDRTVDDWRALIRDHAGWRFNGVALTSTGEILATDVNVHCLHRFTPGGTHVKTNGAKGSGNGQFDTPIDLAIDDQGNVYVADLKNRRVQIFDRELNWKMTVAEGLQSPQGVAVDGTRLYVADDGAKQVVIFEKADDAWRPAQKIDGFQRPFDVAVDQAGRIIVADRKAQAVFVFDRHGKPVQAFEKLGVVNGVAVTPDGTILATAEWNAVHELSLSGPEAGRRR